MINSLVKPLLLQSILSWCALKQYKYWLFYLFYSHISSCSLIFGSIVLYYSTRYPALWLQLLQFVFTLQHTEHNAGVSVGLFICTSSPQWTCQSSVMVATALTLSRTKRHVKRQHTLPPVQLESLAPSLPSFPTLPTYFHNCSFFPLCTLHYCKCCFLSSSLPGHTSNVLLYCGILWIVK